MGAARRGTGGKGVARLLAAASLSCMIAPALPRATNSAGTSRAAGLQSPDCSGPPTCGHALGGAAETASPQKRALAMMKGICGVVLRGGAPRSVGAGEGAAVSTKRVQQDMMKL
jgi:hypothetical protein